MTNKKAYRFSICTKVTCGYPGPHAQLISDDGEPVFAIVILSLDWARQALVMADVDAEDHEDLLAPLIAADFPEVHEENGFSTANTDFGEAVRQASSRPHNLISVTMFAADDPVTITGAARAVNGTIARLLAFDMLETMSRQAGFDGGMGEGFGPHSHPTPDTRGFDPFDPFSELEERFGASPSAARINNAPDTLPLNWTYTPDDKD